MPVHNGAFHGTVAVPMYNGFRNSVRGTRSYGCVLSLKTKDAVVAADGFGLNPAANNVTKVHWIVEWR